MSQKKRSSSGSRDKEREKRLEKRNARRSRKPRVCPFCVGEIDVMDYHNRKVLRKFISDTAKILPRRRTGVCAKHQRKLAITIKRARMLAIIPITEQLVRK